jgi:hypothetical protein
MQVLADRMRLRQGVKGVALRRSGCWSALADPLPELVYALQRQVRHFHGAWLAPFKADRSQQGPSM